MQCTIRHLHSLKAMPSKLPENALVTLLRRCYQSPKCLAAKRHPLPSDRTRWIHHTASNSQLRHTEVGQHPLYHSTRSTNGIDEGNGVVLAEIRRTFASSSRPKNPDEIAVIGGGLTGLTTAFYITKLLPNVKVTLYESGNRLGGWLKSNWVDVGNGKVLFEEGPRSIRPAAPAVLPTLDLIQQLGLEDEIIIVPKNSAAAQNRYIYYPDHLVLMPSGSRSLIENLWTVLTEPIFKGLFPAVYNFLMGEHIRLPIKKQDDYSIESFIRTTTKSDAPITSLVSAVIHGIYAGDIAKLSLKSVFPRVARRQQEAFWRRMLPRDSAKVPYRDLKLHYEMVAGHIGEIPASKIWDSSVFTFKGGIETLTNALQKYLTSHPNVMILKNYPVDRVRYLKASGSQKQHLEVAVPTKRTRKYCRAIATIPARNLAKIVEDRDISEPLSEIPSVTVMVVNLHFASPNLLPDEGGFGYLIPRDIPLEQNPERALGVIFDSCIQLFGNQDPSLGTTLTVMLGGHWWDAFAESGDYPTEAEGVEMAKSLVRRHLKIIDEPVAAQASLNRNCIPQYTVGHTKRMIRAHHSLLSAYGGKLSVAGNSYTGVGVNDCIRAAYEVVRELRNETVDDFSQQMVSGPEPIFNEPLAERQVTGLEQFEDERMVMMLPKQK